jgi:hypothetical protein
VFNEGARFKKLKNALLCLKAEMMVTLRANSKVLFKFSHIYLTVATLTFDPYFFRHRDFFAKTRFGFYFI